MDWLLTEKIGFMESPLFYQHGSGNTNGVHLAHYIPAAAPVSCASG
jgi:hypothetical protein